MTTSPHAYEVFDLEAAGNSCSLRPTLLGASLLVRDYGLNGLYRALDEFNTTIISEIILAAATDKAEARAYLKAIETLPLLTVRLMTVPTLYELIEHFTPAPDPDAKPGNSTSKPMSWPSVYSDMFMRATGWLGWTASETWNSTPREIELAFAGHIDQLKAIHGSAEESTTTTKAGKPVTRKKPADTYSEAQLAKMIESGETDPAFNRSALRSLSGKGNARGDV